MEGNDRGRYWRVAFVSVTFSMEAFISIWPTRDPFNLSGGKKRHCDIFALWWRLSFSYRASDKTKQMTCTSCKYVREGHTQHTLIYIFLFPNETVLTLSHSNNRIWSSFKDLSSNLRNLLLTPAFLVRKTVQPFSPTSHRYSAAFLLDEFELESLKMV